MTSKPTTKAFTLIEMLVAMCVVAAIVTMVYGSYAATSRSVEIYRDGMVCGERAQLVLRLMARQIRCAQAPRPRTGSPGEEAPGSFRGDALDARGRILRLATTRGLSTTPNGSGDLSDVEYHFDNSAGTLAVHCRPSIYDRPAAQSERRQSILHGVTQIELAFYDGRQWQPQWDSAKKRRLPHAVRIALVVRDRSEREHRYETTAPIVCRPAVQP